ncbi:MAG: hypothetical protein GY953_53640 [bacterium]|nr:hypothetical protein [bacterium]
MPLFIGVYAGEWLAVLGLMLWLAALGLVWFRNRAVVILLLGSLVVAYVADPVFLAIGAAAGAGITLAWIANSRAVVSLVAALLLVQSMYPVQSLIFSTAATEEATKADLDAAITFLNESVFPDSALLTEVESKRVLDHYLGSHQSGRVLATRWSYAQLSQVDEDIRRFQLPPGEPVWVMDAGFECGLSDQLGAAADLHRFGPRICIFRRAISP